MAGVQAIRSEGHHEPYMAALTPDSREAITSIVAGVWLPATVAIDHYRAADALGLHRSTIEAMGAQAAMRVHKNLFSSIDAAKTAGITPWKVFSGVQRSNDMNWKGSDVAIYEESPKQALLEWVDQPCANIPYFVTSFGGYMVAVLNRICTRAVYRARVEQCASTTLALRFSWI